MNGSGILAPSAALRTWLGHEPDRFGEFRRRYFDDFRDQRPRLSELRRRTRQGTLTLVYSARNTEHNDAVVLAEAIRRGLPKNCRSGLTVERSSLDRPTG